MKIISLAKVEEKKRVPTVDTIKLHIAYFLMNPYVLVRAVQKKCTKLNALLVQTFAKNTESIVLVE